VKNKDGSPFIIAEMSGNHNQSLERALEIVDAAAQSGAHALKIQTYTPDTMTLDLNEGEFMITNKDNIWKGQSRYELYKKAYTPWEWHAPIYERAKKLGIIPFSSPFDESAVDFLETLDNEIYKIASFEIVDIPLIKKTAATGKPLIMSTGMATVEEIAEAVDAAKSSGCGDLTLLKCTSTYPATPENSNVLTIPHLKEMFGCDVGLSDHTLGIGAAVAAVALGATVVEKHFTLDRNDGGVDSSFSLEPHEFKSLTEETLSAWQSLGQISYGPTKAEEKSVKGRRSLYIAQDVQAGEILTPENVRSIRPGSGLAPKFMDIVLGMPISCDVTKGTPLSWDLLKHDE